MYHLFFNALVQLIYSGSIWSMFSYNSGVLLCQ